MMTKPIQLMMYRLEFNERAQSFNEIPVEEPYHQRAGWQIISVEAPDQVIGTFKYFLFNRFPGQRQTTESVRALWSSFAAGIDCGYQIAYKDVSVRSLN